MRTSGFGESRGSSTSGVLPIDSTMLPKRPPQGRLSSSSRAIGRPVTSKSIARRAAGTPRPCAGHRVSEYFRRRSGKLLDRRHRLDEQVPADRIARGPGGVAVAVFAAGCGSSSNSTTGGGGERRRNADGRLRHPLSAVRAGQTRQLHRLRHRTDGSDRRKDRPHAEFQDTSFETIFRDVAPGQVRSGRSRRRRSPKNARRKSTSPTPTTSPNRRSWSKKAVTSPASPTSRARRRRPAGHDRPGTRQGKSRTPANCGPTPKAPTRSTR